MKVERYKNMRYKKLGEISKDKLAMYAPYITGLLDGEGTFTIRWFNILYEAGQEMRN